MKKFLSTAAIGAAAAALMLATPAVSLAGWHHGGHYHGYRHGHHYHGYYYRGQRCYFRPVYDCAPRVPCVTEDLARIRLLVPCEAKVWIDGQEMAQTGADRWFETPPLEPARDFNYTITARWNAPDGKEVVRDRQVCVRANGTTEVDLR